MHRSQERDTLIECSHSYREESSLRRTRHADGLSIPFWKRRNEIHSTHSSGDDSLIRVTVWIFEIGIPIAVQFTVQEIIIHLLLHRNRNAMNTDFQYDTLGWRGIGIACIRTGTRTRNTEQSRIFTFLYRNTQDAIYFGTPPVVIVTDLIYILILSAALWKQDLGDIQISLASLIQCFLPKSIKIFRFLGIRLNLFGREASGTESFVILSIHMSNDLESVEARLIQASAPFHHTILEGGTFLHSRKHGRTSLIIYLHVVQESTTLPDIYREVGFLAYLVVPVLMIRSHTHYDIVAFDLRAQPERTERTHQNTYNY